VHGWAALENLLSQRAISRGKIFARPESQYQKQTGEAKKPVCCGNVNLPAFVPARVYHEELREKIQLLRLGRKGKHP
jgi:hypothetical protein